MSRTLLVIGLLIVKSITARAKPPADIFDYLTFKDNNKLHEYQIDNAR